jgi:hypothetical protein
MVLKKMKKQLPLQPKNYCIFKSQHLKYYDRNNT